jgi:hypothetical protein
VHESDIFMIKYSELKCMSVVTGVLFENGVKSREFYKKIYTKFNVTAM